MHHPLVWAYADDVENRPTDPVAGRKFPIKELEEEVVVTGSWRRKNSRIKQDIEHDLSAQYTQLSCSEATIQSYTLGTPSL